MRDKIFARQLEVLEQEGKMRSSVLESQKDFNSTGRCKNFKKVRKSLCVRLFLDWWRRALPDTAVMLPPVDRPEIHAANATTFSSTSIKTNTQRPHTFGTMSDNLQGVLLISVQNLDQLWKRKKSLHSSWLLIHNPIVIEIWNSIHRISRL